MKTEIIGQSAVPNKEIELQIESLVKYFPEVEESFIIEILFVDTKEIRKLNFTHRNIDKATDVLSFPQISIAGKNPILGSIVICEEIAKDQGEAAPELIQHGFIHLLGYDHETNILEWNKVERIINAKI
jgi:probable rRNA maturation factor